MDWPRIPVEQIPPDAFVPPHCPNPDCPQHHADAGAFPWRRHGHYVRASDRRRVPRFRCLACRRTFSQQTFATSYWLRRHELLVRIAAQLVAGSCLRQIARTLGCAHTTVARHAARLGRHGMLLLAAQLDELAARGGPPEPLVWDHFETFAISQLLPLAIGTLVAARSGLVLWIDGTIHARGGRRTPAQQRAWQQLLTAHGPPPRGGYRRSTAAMLDRLLETAGPRGIRLVTDGHRAYARAVATAAAPVVHDAHPVPSRRARRADPRAARARDRALRPVDQLHALWRHSHAHDRRETIAFARRHNAAIERAFVVAMWRNWIKRCTERRRGRPTPAQRAGLADRALDWHELLARRLFPDRVRLPEPWRQCYERALRWPEICNWTRHDLKYAF